MIADIEIIDDLTVSMEERLEAASRLARDFRPDMDAVCEIDLHCHSACSDGFFSPSMKVFEAYRRKMKALAIADHDLFDGQREALAAGRIFGIDVIAAAEFYTDRPGVEIIAHFPDSEHFLSQLDKHVFDDTVEPLRNAKISQISSMIARIPACFAKLNFKAEITEDDIAKYTKNGITNKGGISVVMTQKYGDELKRLGLSSDVKDFQARYTTQDRHLNMPLDLAMDISAPAIVRKIRNWGGLPGLPHPTELRKKEKLGNKDLEKLLSGLADVGLQSIEVDGWRNGICPETGLYQTELFEKMRNDYNTSHSDRKPLLFTNGSDDHNQPGEGLELGCGRNRNLDPAFGRYENISSLRARQKELLA